MGTTVALVLFGMFALTTIAIIVLALYAKAKIAKVGINAVGSVFEHANGKIFPSKVEKSEHVNNIRKSNDANSVL